MKALATKIKATQQSEIDRMKSWLALWSTSSAGSMTGSSGPLDPDRSSSNPSRPPVPGPTDEQMDQLTSTSGSEFDKLFLQLMIQDHRGAIGMASTEWEKGSNPDALALAQTIVTDQTAEIDTMQTMAQGM